MNGWVCNVCSFWWFQWSSVMNSAAVTIYNGPLLVLQILCKYAGLAILERIIKTDDPLLWHYTLECPCLGSCRGWWVMQHHVCRPWLSSAVLQWVLQTLSSTQQFGQPRCLQHASSLAWVTQYYVRTVSCTLVSPKQYYSKVWLVSVIVNGWYHFDFDLLTPSDIKR